MPIMPSRNNKKPPIIQTHINSSMYQDSFDLLSASRDFSDQYMPMADPRFTTSQSVRAFDLPPTRTPPTRAQSSRFADRALPIVTFAKSPTMKNILSPRTKLYDEEATLNYSQARSEDGNRNPNLTFTDMGYAEVPAERPRALALPVYETPKSKTFKMHKLKEPNLEDEWNDIVAEKKDRFRDCCCCVFSSSIVALITLGIFAAALYFVLRPYPPTIQVKNMSLTNFKLLPSVTSDSEPSIEAGITCVVRIRNPNKFSTVHHKSVNLTLNFREEVLAHTFIYGFKQSQKNVTDLPADLAKKVVKIDDRLDATELIQEVNLANVRVELRGSAEGHYRLLGINVKSFDAPILCKLNVKPESENISAEIISSSCYTPV